MCNKYVAIYTVATLTVKPVSVTWSVTAGVVTCSFYLLPSAAAAPPARAQRRPAVGGCGRRRGTSEGHVRKRGCPIGAVGGGRELFDRATEKGKKQLPR